VVTTIVGRPPVPSLPESSPPQPDVMQKVYILGDVKR